MPLGKELCFHNIAGGDSVADAGMASFCPLKAFQVIVGAHMAPPDGLNDNRYDTDQDFIMTAFGDSCVKLYIHLRCFCAVRPPLRRSAASPSSMVCPLFRSQSSQK